MSCSENNLNYKKVKFRYGSLREIPSSIMGVYVIWCRSTNLCIYVGQAKKQSIQKRLLDHWNDSHNDLLNDWVKAIDSYLEVCYKKCDTERIDCLEKRLIKKWKPEANKKHNPNEKYKNLNKRYKK